MSCATIVPPTGGPNDTIPPKIKAIFPPDKTINFNVRTIHISFDEYIDLKEQDKRISIYPSVEKPLKTRIKGKEVEIDLPENLVKNTTYKLVLDGCFADIHEGNIMEKKEYVFSTGNHIDSAVLKGFVLDGLNLEKEKEFICVLVKTKKDFESGKYISKEISSDNGEFSFSALNPDMSFYLFAFKDENKDGKWSSDEKIALLKNKVTPKSKPVLYSYDPSGPQKIKGLKNETAGIIEIEFKKEPVGAKIKFGNLDEKLLVTKKEKNKILIYYGPTTITKEKLTIEAKGIMKEEREIALLQNTVRQNEITTKNREETTAFTIDKGITLDWLFPLSKTYPEKIFVYEDTITAVPFKYQIKKNQLIINAAWEDTKEYKLLIRDSAVQNIYGSYNQNYKAFYQAKKTKDKGQVILNLTNLNPQIQYLFHVKQELNEEKPIMSITNVDKIKLDKKDLIPGDFTFLLVIDENKNGVWDKGDYQTDKEPEPVFIIANVKLEEFVDIEQTIDVSRIKN